MAALVSLLWLLFRVRVMYVHLCHKNWPEPLVRVPLIEPESGGQCSGIIHTNDVPDIYR